MDVSIYCRLSEDKYGNSLGVERQESECRAFAEQRGWNVASVFVDNDISATTGKHRPGFEALLASKPEAILCWHTDRLVRLSKDLERVIDLGVNIHAVQAGNIDLSTPAGRATAKTITAWAQYEGEQKAERQKASHRQRVLTGRPWWPTRPFGFERNGAHIADEAKALRETYEFILTGGSLTAAARRLNEAGFTTPKGNVWRAQGLKPILLNARNAGIYVYNDEEIGKAAWEPIVSEEVYRAVVKVLGAPERRTNFGKGGFGKRENLLTGIAVCGKCQSTVRAAWRRKNGQRAYKVYQCGGCKGVTLPAEWCDSVVTREVIKRAEQWSDLLPQEDGAEIAALKVNEADLLERKASLADMERINPEAVRALRESIDLQLGDLANRIAEAGSRAAGTAWLGDIEAMWVWSEDVNRFTPVVRRLTESIVLNGPGKGSRGVKDLRYGTHLVIDWTSPIA